MRKLFGTDGIRGRANQFPMTAETGHEPWKSGHLLFSKQPKPSGRPLIIVGKDTRLSCYMFELALVVGFAHKVKSYLIVPLLTPGVSFVTNNMRAHAGVMIS